MGNLDFFSSFPELLSHINISNIGIRKQGLQTPRLRGAVNWDMDSSGMLWGTPWGWDCIKDCSLTVALQMQTGLSRLVPCVWQMSPETTETQLCFSFTQQQQENALSAKERTSSYRCCCVWVQEEGGGRHHLCARQPLCLLCVRVDVCEDMCVCVCMLNVRVCAHICTHTCICAKIPLWNTLKWILRQLLEHDGQITM